MKERHYPYGDADTPDLKILPGRSTSAALKHFDNKQSSAIEHA
jgi:hypothetical protein